MAAEFRIERPPDAAAFLDAASDFLLAAEAERGLLLGLAIRLAEPGGATQYSGTPRFFAAHDPAGLAMAALVTPPYNLVLTRGPADAAAQMAEAIAADGISLPGVLAPTDAARAFAGAWALHTGAGTREGMSQRIHRLTEVRTRGAARGHMRAPAPGESDLLARWLDAFNRDVGVQVARDGGVLVDETVARGHLFVWDDGGPVSTALIERSTPHGTNIGGVYTPPEQRSRGYATALVAALSQRVLDGGNRFCVLSTDLANPTSNHIYRQIGYEPVCDMLDIRFNYPQAPPP